MQFFSTEKMYDATIVPEPQWFMEVWWLNHMRVTDIGWCGCPACAWRRALPVSVDFWNMLERSK